jgi:hypothetical protein
MRHEEKGKKVEQGRESWKRMGEEEKRRRV